MAGPKKPSKAFVIFTNDERGNILAELGPLKAGEMGKEFGRRWRNLSEEDRREYRVREKEEKERYDEEMRKLGGRLLPKKPLSSYLEFTRLERARVVAELGPMSASEMGKELGRRWKGLPKTEKVKFEEKAERNKTRYKEELTEFFSGAEEMSSQLNSSTPSQASIESSSSSQRPSPSQVLPQCSPTSQETSLCSPTSQSPPQCSPTSQAPPQLSQDQSTPIRISDLGFAKQRFYSWHPALKTGEIARGSRVTVTYFGTGETGTVDRKKWVPYTDQAVARICSPNLLRKTGFVKGLEQLRTTLSKIKSGITPPPMNSGVGSLAQPVKRKLVKLSKDGLQKEEEQNMRLMKDKIVELNDGKFKWGCRDCTWKGKYSHKAKSHARDCGARRRENPRKVKANKFECSGNGCNLTFPYLDLLQKHYRLSHFNTEKNGYRCNPCKKSFTSWDNFKRHNIQKHGNPVVLNCQLCSFKTSRRANLKRHCKLMHGSRKLVTDLLQDIIKNIVEEGEMITETVGGTMVGSGPEMSEGQTLPPLCFPSPQPSLQCSSTSQYNPASQTSLQCSPTPHLSPQSAPLSPLQTPNESLYVKYRDERVAQIQAEFKARFPNFEAEVRDLKDVGKRRKGKKKMTWTGAARRSFRIASNSGEKDFLDLEEVLDAVEDTIDLIPSIIIEDPMNPAPDNSNEESCVHVENSIDEQDRDNAVDQLEPFDFIGQSGAVGDAGDLVALGKHGCLPCNMRFRDASNLQRHVKLVHEKRDIPVECPRTWCNTKFFSLAEMLTHKESCLLVCPYPDCLKTFRKEKRFASHQRSHLAMARRMSDE